MCSGTQPARAAAAANRRTVSEPRSGRTVARRRCYGPPAAWFAPCADWLLLRPSPAAYPSTCHSWSALSHALEAPELNAFGVAARLAPPPFMVVVNGPARHDLRFQWIRQLPGPRQSFELPGRCLSLTTRMVGGAREGFVDMATQGQPGKYTFCFAETRKRLHRPPLHAERGALADQSAVTIGVAGIVEAFEAESYEPERMVGITGRTRSRVAELSAPEAA